MSDRCVYCGKEIGRGEPRLKSVIYENKKVCIDCVWKEDHLWFQSKNKKRFPDFTDELQLENVFNEENEINGYL